MVSSLATIPTQRSIPIATFSEVQARNTTNKWLTPPSAGGATEWALPCSFRRLRMVSHWYVTSLGSTTSITWYVYKNSTAAPNILLTFTQTHTAGDAGSWFGKATTSDVLLLPSDFVIVRILTNVTGSLGSQFDWISVIVEGEPLEAV